MPGRRLTKRDAEGLIAAIDGPGLAEAVSRCLRMLLEVTDDVRWEQLVQNAATIGRWDQARVSTLLARDPAAVEQLAVDLNELRSLS